MTRATNPMTDKERILSALVSQLDSTQLLAKGRGRYYAEDFEDGRGGSYVHFAHYKKPKPGDLVLCQTSGMLGPHPWLIAWYVESGPGSGSAVLREIGTDRLCNMSNESFIPIVGMAPLDLLEGEQHLFHRKVRRAFAKGDEYLYRFGGLEFPETWVGRVWIREAFGGLRTPGESIPFSVDIPFTKRTSIKAILAAMREGGYGTRVFELSSDPAPSTL